MQVLYQLDVRGEGDAQVIRASLVDGPDNEKVQEAAFELATAAWKHHKDADKIVRALAPDWPTHRQPPVDRAILRLAYHEMISGYAPVKVAINEAIELAKQFAAEHSPAFINGVLDRIAKRPDVIAAQQNAAALAESAAPSASAKAWLEDAVDADAPDAEPPVA